ncbi:MAG TPA: hypothetical protein VM715_21360 [Candidatus Acidoferrum sp.]|nr:hypothetical protein [Candidatus Acidoferrum sp.]
MKYRVIALDPGGITGWATYTAERIEDTEGKAEYYDEEWYQGQLEGDDHHERLYRLLELSRVEDYRIVCESFEFRNMDRRHRDNINLMSREYIGVAKLYHQTENVSLFMQGAGLAKGFIPDTGSQANKKLRDAGLWKSGWPHAMDATRHLLYYLVHREGRMDLVERWWKP